jgi:hypothetical protein
MSQPIPSPIPSVDPQSLEAVLGGASPTCSSSDSLLRTLTSLSSTIKDLGTTAHASGFSLTEVMMLGLLMNQRSQVNVFIRRPYW